MAVMMPNSGNFLLDWLARRLKLNFKFIIPARTTDCKAVTIDRDFPVPVHRNRDLDRESPVPVQDREASQEGIVQFM
jgi:hypothetical protein